jgi:hypothetical protein
MEQEGFVNRLRVLKVYSSALALIIFSGSVVRAQQKSNPGGNKGGAVEQVKAPAPADNQAKGKGTWSVHLSKNSPRTFTIKAKDARLGEITSEISRLLKIPVSLSPLMSKQRVTLDFSGMNLEAALRLMAPHPYIDYVAGGEDSPEPKPLAVYLHALNERAPSTTATVKGNSEAMLIEGNTEDGTGSEGDQIKREAEDPVKITYAGRQLSVRARNQPLTIVLFKVANEVGVPFEMRYDTSKMIDVEFSNYSLEQAVRSLSPDVRFYYRADLQTFEIQPLRIALVAPASGRT